MLEPELEKAGPDHIIIMMIENSKLTTMKFAGSKKVFDAFFEIELAMMMLIPRIVVLAMIIKEQ